MNLQIYCLNCEFIGADHEEAARHTATNRGHEILPVRAGDVTPETHTHQCPACLRSWECDNPCCEEADKSECDPCFRERISDSSIY